MAILVLFVPGTILAEDEIWRKGTSAPLTVNQVTAETYEEVRYRKAGIASEQRLSADKVIRIVYGDAPDAFKQGEKFFENYDYENAISSFKLSMEAANARDWVKTYARLWIGRSYQAWGAASSEKYRDAVSTYEELLKEDPKTRFYAEVLFNQAECHSLSGDVSSAVATFDRLSKDAYDLKLGVVWEARAKHGKAEAKLAGGLLDEAERDFRSSMTFAEEQAAKAEDPSVAAELKRLAGLDRLAQGSVMIKRKKYNQAKDFFKQILNDTASEQEARAGAQNGLGECYLAEKLLKDAQMQFAVAKVQYGSVTEEAAKATYFLGVCCEELGDKEPKAKKRAQDYFQEVVDLYGATVWAKEARKKLK
jgi:tetratricopeptide (TPR) repeat protein